MNAPFGIEIDISSYEIGRRGYVAVVKPRSGYCFEMVQVLSEAHRPLHYSEILKRLYSRNSRPVNEDGRIRDIARRANAYLSVLGLQLIADEGFWWFVEIVAIDEKDLDSRCVRLKRAHS